MLYSRDKANIFLAIERIVLSNLFSFCGQNKIFLFKVDFIHAHIHIYMHTHTHTHVYTADMVYKVTLECSLSPLLVTPLIGNVRYIYTVDSHLHFMVTKWLS